MEDGEREFPGKHYTYSNPKFKIKMIKFLFQNLFQVNASSIRRISYLLKFYIFSKLIIYFEIEEVYFRP